MSEALDIIIFGGSGDLANKKIFPAFFSLFSRGLLPEKVAFYAFARSELSQDEFKDKISINLTCRYTPDHACAEEMDKFLSKCTYVQGDYKEDKAYCNLLDILSRNNDGNNADRLFYLAVPPLLFEPVSNALRKNRLTLDDDVEHWSRVIIEKPFGRDRESSDELNALLTNVFDERQIYRIDHYLGKEIVQNILVFRFANIVFQPIWRAEYIEKIEISWAENFGLAGRGGYFDKYGIIRDVIQNHLFQVLALLTMDEPDSLQADDIIDKKVEVLKSVKQPAVEDFVIGQYAGSIVNGVQIAGYKEDPEVPEDSITPTFAFLRVNIDNDRWRGMPIEITAGKGLNERKAEIRITFKRPCGNIFCKLEHCPPNNELIIRIQPDEGFHFIVSTKVPGTKMEIQSKELDLSYNQAFQGDTLPDAYENLLLDAIHGEKTLFIRDDELQEAWNILTPALKKMESERIVPLPYEFGSKGLAVPRYKKEHCFNNKK